MTSADFATVARVLQARARELGWHAPAFRSPPHGSVGRSIIRLKGEYGGQFVVCVRLRERSNADVIGDMVDGTLAGNGKALDDPERRGLIRVANEALGASAVGAT